MEVPGKTNDPFYSKMCSALVTVVRWWRNPPRENYEGFPPPQKESQFVHAGYSTMTCLYTIIPQIPSSQTGPLAGPAGWSRSFQTRRGKPSGGLCRMEGDRISSFTACWLPAKVLQRNSGAQPLECGPIWRGGLRRQRASWELPRLFCPRLRVPSRETQGTA